MIILTFMIIGVSAAENTCPVCSDDSVNLSVIQHTGENSNETANNLSMEYSSSISIPASSSNGVKFIAPDTATYTFVIKGGAGKDISCTSSNPYPCWFALLCVYKNRSIKWGSDIPNTPDNLLHPIDPDYQLGSFGPFSSLAVAEAATKGDSFSVKLNKGDYIRVIFYSVRSQYAHSMGEMTLGITGTKIQAPQLTSLNAAMVSPNELGIGVKGSFPSSAIGKRYLTIKTKINGKSVQQRFDVTEDTTPGKEFTIGLDINGNIIPENTKRIDLSKKDVPRFEDNINFAVKGFLSYEGGVESNTKSKKVDVLLPVVVLHGYIAETPDTIWNPILRLIGIPPACDVKGYPYGEPVNLSCNSCANTARFRNKAYSFCYQKLSEALKKNHYTIKKSSSDTRYITLWDPKDRRIGYSSVSYATASDINSDFTRIRDLVRDNSYANKFNIVAHSTGGLTARYWALLHSDSISTVITVGTPHDGITRFYEEPFKSKYENRPDFISKCLKTTVGGSTDNTLAWFVPKWDALDESRVTAPKDPSNPLCPFFSNSYEWGFTSKVKFYVLYSKGFDTPYEVVIEERENGWYDYVKTRNEIGDGYIYWKSAAAKYSGPAGDTATFKRIEIPKTAKSKKHGELMIDPFVKKEVISILLNN
ncbi:alpha/beta fold hydrolase [bacterium]|nr:alpha/beta fold hydrolase [bacterium]